MAKVHAQVFFREPKRVHPTASEWRHRLHGDNIVDHVVCLKTEFLWQAVLSNENGEFYTYDIYPYLNRSVCLLMGSPTWWRFTFCSSRSSLVFWWRDAPLVREFQMWGRRCKQWDSHWFQGHKMRFGGIWSTMSWQHFLIYLVRLICTTVISLGPICMLFTTLDWLLSLPVDHSWQPMALKWDGETLDWCQLYCLGKYLILELIFLFLY